MVDSPTAPGSGGDVALAAIRAIVEVHSKEFLSDAFEDSAAEHRLTKAAMEAIRDIHRDSLDHRGKRRRLSYAPASPAPSYVPPAHLIMAAAESQSPQVAQPLDPNQNVFNYAGSLAAGVAKNHGDAAKVYGENVKNGTEQNSTICVNGTKDNANLCSDANANMNKTFHKSADVHAHFLDKVLEFQALH